jgi:hypothetical protein
MVSVQQVFSTGFYGHTKDPPIFIETLLRLAVKTAHRNLKCLEWDAFMNAGVIFLKHFKDKTKFDEI